MEKLLSHVLFYGILMPISLLPMRLLYLLSDVICFILKHIVKYRKNVILSNLRNSFPEKDEKEIRRIADKYYVHLSDLVVESIKMLTISRKNLLKRYKCTNPSILYPYFSTGRSVLLVSAHYNNWEYMVASLELQLKHHGIGVGKRMSNKTFEELVFKRRTRYGTEVCYADNSRKVLEDYDKAGKACAYMLLSDQSPNNTKKCYWTDFLHQKTAVIYGPEYIAKKYDYPVFFYKVSKTKRGYYSFEIVKLTDEPRQTPYGWICEQALMQLKSMLDAHPQYWLWSHRRWKHKYEESMGL